MNKRVAHVVTLLFAVAVGAAGSQILHAQTKTQAYVIGEIDIRDEATFDKEYVPPAAKAVIDGGAKYIVRGGRSVSLYGEPPKRIAIMAFGSLEKAEAAFKSPAYISAKKIGDKYANFRIYAVEGLPQ
jgi:uncharacterized protein (DUF1330 family)